MSLPWAPWIPLLIACDIYKDGDLSGVSFARKLLIIIFSDFWLFDEC